MSAPIMQPGYVDEAFLNEVREFGQVLYFSYAAQSLGFSNPWDDRQRDAFLNYRHPVTGERLLRWQANSPDWLYGLIPSVTASVNLWTDSFTHESLEKFLREDLRQANDIFLGAIDRRLGVRVTVDGEKRILPAEMSWLSAAHVHARNGEKSIHVHNIGHRGAIPHNGDSLYSLADRREIVRSIADATKLFHACLAMSIEKNWGVKTAFLDGKCEIPAYQQIARELGGTRRKEMKDYLAARGVKPTGAAMAYAAINTRPAKKQEFTAKDRIPYWNGKAAQLSAQVDQTLPPDPSPIAQRFKALFNEFIVQPARVIGLAYKLSRKDRPETIRVRNVEALLEDTKVRSRKEGHKAALRALRRTNLRGLSHALKVAEDGYRRGRKPVLTLPRGTRIVLSKQAAEAMTPKQSEELMARAMDNGWVLRIPGLEQGQGLSRNS